MSCPPERSSADPVSGDRPFTFRAVADADQLRLWHAALAAGPGWPRMWLVSSSNPHRFHAAFWAGVHLALFAEVDGRPSALCVLYNVDFCDGSAWLEIVPIPRASEPDVPPRIIRGFVDVVLARWPLRNLYAEHLSMAAPPLAGLGCHVVEVGRLKESVWAEGFHWDRVFSALDVSALRDESAASASLTSRPR